jgi:hypothetical protein
MPKNVLTKNGKRYARVSWTDARTGKRHTKIMLAASGTVAEARQLAELIKLALENAGHRPAAKRKASN